MIEPTAFLGWLRELGIEFFTGVPDSTLKRLTAAITTTARADEHVIAASEGGAVALASGYHLATGRLAMVYMQNSGLGNATNPLLSLADREVYGIPMLLLIGWRGEPGRKDEPQHVKQGRITRGILEMCEIPHLVLSAEETAARKELEKAVAEARRLDCPYALVARVGLFGGEEEAPPEPSSYSMSREEALTTVLDVLGPDDVTVCTTGKASRELFEYRCVRKQTHSNDFLTVGSMGHASQIALGIALHAAGRRVVCIDGDGAVIMHMGALAIIGQRAPPTFLHVILNNGAHDSVGGQPTAGFEIDVVSIATSCGYRLALRVETMEELRSALRRVLSAEGPAMLEVRVRKGARANLGRPTSTPQDNKRSLMKLLSP